MTLTPTGPATDRSGGHAPSGAPTVPAPRRAPVARVGTDDRTGDVLVTLTARDACARSAAALSCTLHSAVESAVGSHRGAVVVDLAGASADDPCLARILACARESAAARGVALQVVGSAG